MALYDACMRILIAPDAFKGSLTSTEAAVAMASGIRAAMPDAEIIPMPLADGGEGTLDVLHVQCGGEVRNDILCFHDRGVSCGLIESTRLIGLTLPDMPPDVFRRGSLMLGRAVLSALDAGVRDVRIALGGSATVDGGLGFLTALGCRVLDKHGVQVSADLNGMMQADSINLNNMDQRLKDVRITGLCDVQNPLCGHRGAVYVYGPQKGIESDRLPEVEMAMQHWAVLCEQAFGVSAIDIPGAGAAGGLGFALGLLEARIVSGADYIMAASGFDQIVETVEWVITGEGRSDVQTLDGKLPFKVAQAARKAAVSVALISGDVPDIQNLADCFDIVMSARAEGISEAESMARAKTYLHAAAERWARGL